MDARTLLAATRQEIEARFQALRQVPGDAARRGLLRRLAERWTLEEQWLYPALAEAANGERSAWEAHEQELAPLRELAAQAEADPADRIAARLAVLEGIVLLHLESVARLLEAPWRVDWQRLGADMAAMEARWAAEVAATGDIEDEEADPVGRPPR